MKIRTKELGDKNIIGAQVTKYRKLKSMKQKDFISLLQLEGLDMNPTSASKLEGQTRQVIDKEVLIISKALGVPIANLFPNGF